MVHTLGIKIISIQATASGLLGKKKRHLLGNVAVVSYFNMTQDVGQLLQDKNFDLIDRAAEFKVTQVQPGREALLTSFVIGKYVLFEERDKNLIFFVLHKGKGLE